MLLISTIDLAKCEPGTYFRELLDTARYSGTRMLVNVVTTDEERIPGLPGPYYAVKYIDLEGVLEITQSPQMTQGVSKYARYEILPDFKASLEETLAKCNAAEKLLEVAKKVIADR